MERCCGGAEVQWSLGDTARATLSRIAKNENALCRFNTQRCSNTSTSIARTSNISQYPHDAALLKSCALEAIGRAPPRCCILTLLGLAGPPHAQHRWDQSRMPARKLAQKASGLLKGLRSKQSLRRNGKSRENNREKAVDVPANPDPEQIIPDTRRPRHATAEGATTLGKRRRYSTRSMTQNIITIHEDAQESTARLHGSGKMSAPLSQAELFDQDSDSTESEDEIDDSVLDDMHKLEESFAGISQRYRLVNRIGEGMFSTARFQPQLICVRHLLDCVQGRTVACP